MRSRARNDKIQYRQGNEQKKNKKSENEKRKAEKIMLNVGVIGMWRNGKRLSRESERTQGAQVVAVSDVFEEGAKKAAEIAGGAKVYTMAKT